MANLDFFAAERDQRALISFLCAETDVRIFDSASVFDQELREFRTLDELAATHALGQDPHGSGHAILLQLWSPAVMTKLDIRRIELDPATGHSFRYTLEGGALMQLYFGGVHESKKHGRVLTKSHYGHNSESRATSWNVAEGANWEALKKLSNRIRYFVKSRLEVAKIPGRPILEHAYELAKEGYKLKEMAQAPFAWPLPPASPVPPAEPAEPALPARRAAPIKAGVRRSKRL